MIINCANIVKKKATSKVKRQKDIVFAKIRLTMRELFLFQGIEDGEGCIENQCICTQNV